jgi:hypothetical protein
VTAGVRRVAIGATATIGQAIARRYARAGPALTLVARDPARLEFVAADRRALSASSVVAVVADLASGSALPSRGDGFFRPTRRPILRCSLQGSLTDQARAGGQRLSRGGSHAISSQACRGSTRAEDARGGRQDRRADRIRGGRSRARRSLRVRRCEAAIDARHRPVRRIARRRARGRRQAGSDHLADDGAPRANLLWTTADTAAATIVAGIARGAASSMRPDTGASPCSRCAAYRAVFQRLRG